MKLIKRLGLAITTLALTVSLAACTEDSERNTVVPYGDLVLSDVVASSKDDSIKLTVENYYNRLRAKSYDIFTEELKKVLYKTEFDAIKSLLASTSYDANASYAKALSYTDEPISEERYEELKEIFEEEISNTYASAIFGTTSAETFKSKTQDEINTYINKYIDNQARKNIKLTAENIQYTTADDLLVIDFTKLPSDLTDYTILTKAENFYAQKELYKIADLEYLNAGTDEEEKNSYYLFKESSLESSYTNTYKTFGTYKAIIITFNSRLDAMTAMEQLAAAGITEINETNVENAYLTLYNNRYSYKGAQDINSEDFIYEVSMEKDELTSISSSVNTLITQTLENGEFLTTPRNLNNKYVLAYRISTEYEYHNGTDKSEQIDYSELDETTKADIDTKLKNNIVKSSSNSYQSVALKELIETSDIEIYDPFFEYKFNYTYTDQYELTENFNENAIFKCNDTTLSVSDFYTLASSRLASSVVTTYFQHEYAYQFADEFIDEETIETNTTTVEDAIKVFENDENSTYPKEVGLATYLLSSYGYTTKEDVIKYYYTATSALTQYKSKVIFDSWASDADENGVRGISEEAKKVLNEILAVGNAEYNNIFALNVDHILINTDENGDGTPDDPDKFMSELTDAKKAEFEAAVATLTQAIYKEAIDPAYEGNTLYETLSYIVKQYNKGAQLLSDSTKTWNDYKSEFRFLLTCEQLASSGDITQDSVNNFVKPFATYLEDMYAEVSAKETTINEDGNFYVVGAGVLDKAEQASSITASSLCKTVYGYHLIVLNSYDGPESLKYTEDNDTNGYQKNIKILLNENDEDSDDDNLVVTISSYNDNEKEANINQLFIYYVQSQNGVDSSLDADIEQMLATLFDDAISMYTSSNFQTYILFDAMGIKSTNQTITDAINAEKTYYGNLIINYDNTSEFASWLTKDWTRPQN